MEEVKKHGGARIGAGRSREKNKRMRIPIWLRKSVIKENGGNKSTQKKIVKLLEKEGWKID